MLIKETGYTPTLPGSDYTQDNPLVGYDNRATVDNLATTTEDADNPAINLANENTAQVWKGGAPSSPPADEYLTVTGDLSTADYIGIAVPNFSAAGVAVSIEELAGSPPTWVEIIEPNVPEDDGTLIFRFAPGARSGLRVRLQPGTDVPSAAVLFVGTLLILERRLYVGHAPLGLSSEVTSSIGMAEGGAFLGKVLIGEKFSTSVSLQNLTPAWVRASLKPFLAAAKTLPFFFAWRPDQYPGETGFCWLTSAPRPTNQSPNGLMSVSFDMDGIA